MPTYSYQSNNTHPTKYVTYFDIPILFVHCIGETLFLDDQYSL